MEDELLKSLLENSEEEDDDFPFGDLGLDDWDEEEDKIEDEDIDDEEDEFGGL